MRNHLFYSFRLLAIVYSVLWMQPLRAQEDAGREFYFAYVCHEEKMSDGSAFDGELLTSQLKQLREDIAYSFGGKSQAVFYLSNGVRIANNDYINEHPVTATVNLGGENEEGDFDKFLSEIKENDRHDVNVDVDIDNILYLLSQYDFLKPDGTLAYNSVTFDFFVHQDFWDSKCNERLVAALYFVLDFNRFTRGNTETFFNIHYTLPKEPAFVRMAKPFGAWNINDINYACNMVSDSPGNGNVRKIVRIMK